MIIINYMANNRTGAILKKHLQEELAVRIKGWLNDAYDIESHVQVR
jgi:hypothetical protein